MKKCIKELYAKHVATQNSGNNRGLRRSSTIKVKDIISHVDDAKRVIKVDSSEDENANIELG